jgi:hypothetical protein
MRSLIVLLIASSALMSWPRAAARQTGPQIVDNREPFAIELPELNTGLLPAAAHLEIPVPSKPLTRIKLWVVQPFATRIGYRGINATFNRQSLSTVSKKGSGLAGNFLDVDLRANPNLVWRADKNVLEITAQEERGNITYRCTFVLLPGKAATTRPARPTLAEGCATEIRAETRLVPEDPHVLQSDRVAPQLTLTAPQAAFNATSGAQTVVVTGTASDDSGIVRSVTVNGQLIASTPVPKDKRFKLPPLKKGDKNKTAAPPPLTFNAAFTVNPGTRALLVEATDASGNSALITVPILQSDCAGATVAQRQAVLAATTTTGFSGRRYAVLVGVSKYKYSEGGLRNLSYAHQDAEAIRDWLRSDSGGAFKPADIVCLTDGTATRAAVRAALERFLTAAGANDLIYLFMAGHGAPDPFDRSKLYFLLHDSKLTDLPNTALAMSEVGEFVNQQSKQARLIAFFDTCHSAGVNRQALKPAPQAASAKPGDSDKRGVGSKKDKPAAPPANQPPTVTPSGGAPSTSAAQPGFNFYEGTLFQKKGWTVISSSGMNEESQEAAHWRDQAGHGHGVFTWALLEGANGKADANGDCQITAAELFSYIKKTVSSATSGAQNPQLLPGANGKLEVAVAPNCKR